MTYPTEYFFGKAILSCELPLRPVQCHGDDIMVVQQRFLKLWFGQDIKSHSLAISQRRSAKDMV